MSDAPKVYWRRYYILSVFCLELLILLTTFNSFAPISNSLEYAMAFTDQDLVILTILNNVVFLFFAIPASWFLNRFGIRIFMVCQSVAVTVTMILRCLPTKGRTFVILCIVQNSLASAISVGIMIVPPLLSVRWFPRNEWRFATGIGIFLPAFGASFAYKIGPAVVPSPDTGYTADEIEHRIRYYYYGLTVVCALSALLIIAYFPDHPPTPPTNVAEYETGHTMSLKDSIWTLVKSRRFWLCCFRTLMIGSPVAALGGLLLPYLRPKHISQDYAGTIGLVSSLLGIVVALILGKVADLTKTHVKALIVAPTVLSCEGAIWLFLMGHGYLPLTDRSVFVATCLYVTFGSACLGLVIELACENDYPVPEQYVTAMIQVGSTATVVIIAGVFMVPSTDVAVIDYVVLVFSIVGTIGCFFLPTEYKRFKAEDAARKKSGKPETGGVSVISGPDPDNVYIRGEDDKQIADTVYF